MLLRHTYHIIVFDRSIDAAAFVAALSRFLNSPEGSSYHEHQRPMEVWGRPPARGGTIKIYLSDAALEAALARFAPVPVGDVLGAQELPGDCMLILGGREIPSWGLAEAQRVLGGAR
jgi:hypothetical protein